VALPAWRLEHGLSREPPLHDLVRTSNAPRAGFGEAKSGGGRSNLQDRVRTRPRVRERRVTRRKSFHLLSFPFRNRAFSRACARDSGDPSPWRRAATMNRAGEPRSVSGFDKKRTTSMGLRYDGFEHIGNTAAPPQEDANFFRAVDADSPVPSSRGNSRKVGDHSPDLRKTANSAHDVSDRLASIPFSCAGEKTVTARATPRHWSVWNGIGRHSLSQKCTRSLTSIPYPAAGTTITHGLSMICSGARMAAGQDGRRRQGETASRPGNSRVYNLLFGDQELIAVCDLFAAITIEPAICCQ
jgi:hypothetical protein